MYANHANKQQSLLACNKITFTTAEFKITITCIQKCNHIYLKSFIHIPEAVMSIMQSRLECIAVEVYMCFLNIIRLLKQSMINTLTRNCLQVLIYMDIGSLTPKHRYLIFNTFIFIQIIHLYQGTSSNALQLVFINHYRR